MFDSCKLPGWTCHGCRVGGRLANCNPARELRFCSQPKVQPYACLSFIPAGRSSSLTSFAAGCFATLEIDPSPAVQHVIDLLSQVDQIFSPSLLLSPCRWQHRHLFKSPVNDEAHHARSPLDLNTDTSISRYPRSLVIKKRHGPLPGAI